MPFPYQIIDAHHHFWDLDKVHYPWLATKGIVRFFGDPAPIQKNYLVEDLRADAANLPLIKSVHIQVGAADDQHLHEAHTIEQIAKQHGLGDGIVAFVALESDDYQSQLDALSSLERLRGVRQIIGRSPEEDAQTDTGSLITNPNWLRGLNELAHRGLSFDCQLIPEQMQDVVAVLNQVPKLRVALCHCGSPWYTEQNNPKGWQMWQDGIAALAQRPNTVCKISGLTMFNHHWTVDSLKPVIYHVLDCFGSERVLLGSNFPVDKLHASYVDLWHAYQEILETHPANFSPAQIQAMFANNAIDFYCLN